VLSSFKLQVEGVLKGHCFTLRHKL